MSTVIEINTSANPAFVTIPEGAGLPDQAGHAGQFLTTDGSTLSWAAVAGGGSLQDAYDGGNEITIADNTPVVLERSTDAATYYSAMQLSTTSTATNGADKRSPMVEFRSSSWNSTNGAAETQQGWVYLNGTDSGGPVNIRQLVFAVDDGAGGKTSVTFQTLPSAYTLVSTTEANLYLGTASSYALLNASSFSPLMSSTLNLGTTSAAWATVHAEGMSLIEGANRSISVAARTDNGNGYDLTVQSGQGGGGALSTGGNLRLRAGTGNNGYGTVYVGDLGGVVSIGATGVTATVVGSLSVTQTTTLTGATNAAGGFSSKLDASSATTLYIGTDSTFAAGTATAIALGRQGVNVYLTAPVATWPVGDTQDTASLVFRGRYNFNNTGSQNIDYGIYLNVLTPTATGGLLTFSAGSAGDVFSIGAGGIYSEIDTQLSVGSTSKRFCQLVVGDTIGTSQAASSGVYMLNNTAAAAGAQQYSPMIEFEGQGWKTDATAGSQPVKMAWQLRPVQGTSAPTGQLVLWRSINNAAYSETGVSIDTSGTVTAPTVTCAAVEGTYSIGANLQGADADNNNYAKYVPAEAAASTWYQWVGQFTNAGGARKNQVLRMGWNLGGGGGVVDNTKQAIGDEWESYYNPAGTAYMERHIAAVAANSTVWRPLSILFRGDNVIQTLMQQHSLQWLAPDGNSYYSINTSPGVNTYFNLEQNGSGFRHLVNNAQFLMQMNAAASGYISLVRLNGSDEVALAPDGNAAAIVANATLKNGVAGNQTTTVGAAGGADALPATPLGYLTIKIADDTSVKVPYYNAS